MGGTLWYVLRVPPPVHARLQARVQGMIYQDQIPVGSSFPILLMPEVGKIEVRLRINRKTCPMTLVQDPNLYISLRDILLTRQFQVGIEEMMGKGAPPAEGETPLSPETKKGRGLGIDTEPYLDKLLDLHDAKKCIPQPTLHIAGVLVRLVEHLASIYQDEGLARLVKVCHDTVSPPPAPETREEPTP